MVLEMDDQFDSDDRHADEVRRMVEEARRDTRLIPAAEVLDRLEAKYRAMARRAGPDGAPLPAAS